SPVIFGGTEANDRKAYTWQSFPKDCQAESGLRACALFLRCELGPDRACAGMTRMAGSAAPVEGELGIAIELDTAAGDTLPVLCIVSLKAGRTAGPQAA